MQTFTQDKGLYIVDLTKRLAEQTREIIWKYRFEKHKVDAAHLATAIYLNQYKTIDEFHTFDHDLLKLNDNPDIPIPIIRPTEELYPPTAPPPPSATSQITLNDQSTPSST